MDPANATIDRHMPVIPDSVSDGLDRFTEKAMTALKNRMVLPRDMFRGMMPATRREGAPKDLEPRIITDEILARCEKAIAKCVGEFNTEGAAHLAKRGITEAEIERYRMCGIRALVAVLGMNDARQMSIVLPSKLKKFTSGATVMEGVSIPYNCASGKFLGFITRIVDCPLVKYACSVPNRMCFGTDFSLIGTDKDEVWVVEGAFDAIALKRIGLNPLGQGDSQPNYFRMSQAARFKRIVLLGDGDQAGLIGTAKAWIVLTRMLEVDPERIRIMLLPLGLDPEEAVRQGRFYPKEVSAAETFVMVRSRLSPELCEEVG